MIGYMTAIKRAELMAMSPEAVADSLKRRAGTSRDEADPVNEDTERALRDRGDALIELALARYGKHIAVVSDLFQAAAPRSAIRLACLTNRVLDNDLLSFPFPVGLFGHARRDSGRMVEWLLSAANEELDALFENPNQSDNFLTDVLERNAEWATVPDDTLCRIVHILRGNPRMWIPWHDDWMDGYAEYRHTAVFNAAWMLAEKVPVTDHWASALGGLYERLEPDCFAMTNPLAVAQRWHVDPDDEDAVVDQDRAHQVGFLGRYECVRHGLAQLALHKNRNILGSLLNSDDIALRAAAYSGGDLSLEQLQEGYERDFRLAYYLTLNNRTLWTRESTRQALWNIGSEVVKSDEHGDLNVLNSYIAREKQMREEHPAWFAEEPASE